MRIFVGKRRRWNAALRINSGLSDGYSASITTEIARLEEQLAAIRERLKTSDAATVKLQMRDTRRVVETRLQNLSALWEGEPRIAREEIAKHVQKITLKPTLRTYVATGTWDWLGVLGHAATMVVPEARFAPFAPHRSAFPWLRDGEYQPKRQVKNTDIPIVMNVRLPILRAR